jgi:hypothetical protein
MGNLADVRDFLNDDGGFDTPPIPSTQHPAGHQYRVPSPDALTGLWLTATADLTIRLHEGAEPAAADLERLQLDDSQERDFISQVLSPDVVEAMKADGVRWEHMRRMALYAYLYFTVGEQAAERARAGGLLAGKAPSPNRAQRRRGTAAAGTATGSGSRALSREKPKGA